MNKTIEELNRLYNDADEVDQQIFAEMRTNILLVAGDHYARKSAKFTERIRDSRDLPEDAKLRLTRNHIQRISKIYVNAITSLSPGVSFEPNNATELADQKAAELHQSVWEFTKKEQKFRSKVLDYATDYVNFGECAVKLYWDWQKGTFLGYNQKQVVDENDEPVIDPNTGQPQMEEDTENPKWSGQLVYERIYAFNLFRPKTSQSMQDAPWLGIRKMAQIKDLQSMFDENDEKQDYLKSDSETTYLVFDAHKGNYETTKDQVMLREIYYRPCHEYPNGYYYVFTNSGVLWEGELPFGIFPIVWAGFDQLPTTPRALSPIKTWKPYQVELNRVASKMAEHQITLGDDKLVISNNAKISSAGTAPGVRAYSVSGPSAPTVIPGRTGDQYLPYMETTIREMYQVAMVSEMLEEKQQPQVEAYALLLQSAKWKQKFSIYSERFEQFLIDLSYLSMELTRKYVTEEALIPMIGKREQVNISEFKNAKPMGYQIKIEPQTEDVESKMGRQLTLNHIIQYAGQNMDKEDLGKLFRQLPFLNNEELMSDLTQNYDIVTNMILAMDRGEPPEINPYVEAPYVIKRLSKRMTDPDFKFLPLPTQQMYQQAKQAYMQMDAKQKLELQRAEQGFIPTDGYLVTTQVYAPDPKTGTQKLLKLPYSSIVWLAKQLEAQGLDQASMESLNQGNKAEIAQMMNRFQPAPQAQPGQMPPRPMMQ